MENIANSIRPAKDAWKIVNDTLGLPEKKWKTFKDKCGNG